MSFARTKIQPPRPRAGLLLPRPALERSVVSALATHRVVLLCAPAGYGKTALLVRSLESATPPPEVAWISLDPGDDLYRLLECLTAALEPLDPPWRTAPEGLIAAATRAGSTSQREIADELVNTLEACDVERGVIVFDDLHHVDDLLCLAFLDLLIQRLGSRWSIAITARHEPALRLTRLRAAGELADIRQAQLQFGRDDVRALLADGGFDSTLADALYERTGGWAAGLRLALNGARGGRSSSAIDREAFDFLASEVLARIDPALREFLLLTSVLTDLDPQRCAAVSGDAASASRLEEIERLGLFASVVDEANLTLRLHDLFRDALQHRARLERPEQWPELLERAAALEDDPVRRHGLLLAAQRYDQAAAALLADGPPLITHGAVNTVLQLCAQFPQRFADTSAELHYIHGVAQWTVFDLRAWERHMARAEALYTARGDLDAARAARGHNAAALIGLGRLQQAGALLAQLQREPLTTKARIITLVASGWYAVESSQMHRVTPIVEALVQTLEPLGALEDWFHTVPPPRLIACRGVAPALTRWATGVLAVAGERFVPLRANALLTQSWLAFWQGRLDDARSLLERSEADAKWTGHQVVVRSHTLANKGMQCAVRGDCETALAAMRDRLAEHPPNYGDWGRWHLLFHACRVAAACGDLPCLREWLQTILALQSTLSDTSPTRLRPVLAMQGTLASLEGRADDAIAIWRSALQHEEEIDLLSQANEVRARLAQALLRRQALAEAAEVLVPLLAPAADGPSGALLAGTALTELAAAPWGRHLSADAIATLQRWAAPLRASASAQAATSADPGVDVNPRERLTARELEVLSFIANGDSNKVIARALDLSPHTVKRHVAHILDRLDLASRGQAAAWYHAQAAEPARRVQ